jgi:hypothetical protein
MKKNEKQKQEQEIRMETISLGEIEDDNGVAHHTPKERYLETQNINSNLIRVKTKILVIEVLAYLLISFSVVSSVSTFFKESPGHYVQPPNGIVENIEVRR